jgi:hypothetical protein
VNLALNGNLRGWNLPVLAYDESWVVTENPNAGAPRLEIQRVDITGWGLAAIGGAITYGAGVGGNAGNARVANGYVGTFDGHPGKRFWITVFNDLVWACDPQRQQPQVERWEAHLITVDLLIGAPVITRIHVFDVAAPQQGQNCPSTVAPYDEPFTPAVMISENLQNQKEQVWLQAPWNVGTKNNMGGLLLLYQF